VIIERADRPEIEETKLCITKMHGHLAYKTRIKHIEGIRLYDSYHGDDYNLHTIINM
jgi:hypothetical protein